MGLFDMVNSFLNPQRGYEAAMGPVNKGWKEARGYQEPYNNAGQSQIGRLTGAEDRLLDPMGLENEWSQGYETSPYARDMLERNKTSGLDAASAMGLGGSSAALNNIQQGAGQIHNADRQQFMQNLMQKFLAAIGIGQNMFGVGATTAANLGKGATEHGQDIGMLNYNATNAPGDLLKSLIQAGIKAYGASQGAGAGAGA